MGRKTRQLNVKRLLICFYERGKKEHVVCQPTWKDVHAALCGFKTHDVGHIALFLEGDIDMGIYGEPHQYHIAIVDEQDVHYYYWNNLKPTDSIVDVAWHSFPAHQICTDFQLVVKIVKTFYETGERLDEVKWEKFTYE
jgi:hypothetical protein